MKILRPLRASFDSRTQNRIKAFESTTSYPKFVYKAAKWASEANIPRLGFIVGIAGDIIGGLIIAWQTAQNSLTNQFQKQGIIAAEMAKVICNFFSMAIYELSERLLSKYLLKLPMQSAKALSQIAGMLFSFVFQDCINPFLKSGLTALIAKSLFPETVISLLSNKKQIEPKAQILELKK